MALETPTYISDFVSANPLDLDPQGQGAAHLRNIKIATKATFPNVTGAVTATHGSLNAAAALQPSGTGQLVIPAVAVVGSKALWTGLTGTLGFIGKALASKWTLSSYDPAGPTTTQLMEVNSTGQLTLTGDLVVGGGDIFAGTTQVSMIGTIVLWYGSVAAIPVGWSLCDGTNGTPDLRGRFPIGAGGAYAVAATGGAATVTLIEANLPAHSHTITDPGHTHVAYQAAHTHTITDPGHTHTGASLQPASTPGLGIAGSGVGYTFDAAPSATTGISLANATPNITVEDDATNITVDSTGSGTSVAILPPYHALAFIMRTA